MHRLKRAEDKRSKKHWHKPRLLGTGIQAGGSLILSTHLKKGMTAGSTGEPVLWWLDIYLRDESQRAEEFRIFIVKIGYSWRQSTVTDGVCKGNVSCTSYSRTFTIHKWLRQTAYILTHNNITLEHIANNGMNTTTHIDANIAQFWARRAPSVDAHVFIHRTCGSSLALCVSFPSMVIGMRTCSWVSSSLCLSTSSSSLSSTFSWILPWCLTRIPWKIPCATPASGAWSLWTVSHPTQVMSPRTWSSQTPMSWTSRLPAISTSRTPWTIQLPSPTFLTSTTMSLQNPLHLWSIEQGNLLRWEATMINFSVTSETWNVLRVSFLKSLNPKEWSIKLAGLFKKGSLRSVKALTHRLGQCWMNNEEQLSLNAVRKFFITNSSQLKPNKIAKFFKKNYCDSNRTFVKFISRILWNRRDCTNSKILPSMSSPRRNSSRIRTLLWKNLEDFKNYTMKWIAWMIPGIFGMLSWFVVEIHTLPVHQENSLDILHLKDFWSQPSHRSDKMKSRLMLGIHPVYQETFLHIHKLLRQLRILRN